MASLASLLADGATPIKAWSGKFVGYKLIEATEWSNARGGSVNSTKSSNSGVLFGCWAAATFAGLIYFFVPIHETFEFGGDEGMELAKALGYYKGFHLYTQIWDDQPPLFTILISIIFGRFGISVFAARLMVLCFASTMIGVLHSLILSTNGRIAAAVALVSFIVSPLFVPISVCVVQEVPAITLGLLATLILFQWEKSQRSSLLLISGAIMGCAMQIKLTAVLLLPAELAVICLKEPILKNRQLLKVAIRSLILWSLGLFIGFSAILFAVGGVLENLRTALATHFGRTSPIATAQIESHAFDIGMLEGHIEIVTAAALGIVIICWRGAWRTMRFPIILLFTACLMFGFHRPIWNFYYFYLSIPMVWIGAYAIAIGMEGVPKLRSLIGGTTKFSTMPFFGVCVSLFLCLIIVERGLKRVRHDIAKMSNLTSVDADPMIAKISECRGDARWIYTPEGLYAVYTKLLIPPEIVVTSLKRIWTGQITEPQIVAYVKEYRPEFILLPLSEASDSQWKSYLDANYILILQDTRHVLFEWRGLQGILKLRSTKQSKASRELG